MHVKKTRSNLKYLPAVTLFVAARLAAGPPAPNLISPANGSSVQTPVALSWSAVTSPNGIGGYSWEVSATSSFSSIAFRAARKARRREPSAVSQMADTSGGFNRSTRR